MLSKQDDFIGHQLPTTFDHVMSSDPAWMERLWYTGHPVPGGDFIFDIGLGWHPNRNVMDGFAGVAFGGKQYNFRVSRRLRPNPLETTIGPLEIEILEGLRHHRLTLKPNESGLAFDLEFLATMNPHEEGEHFRRRSGRVTEHMARAQQLGAYRGWIEVAGERREISQANWLGQRDHSWGIRAEMRTDETNPPLTFYPPFFYCWTTAQFKDRGLHVFFKERAPGDKIYISGEEVAHARDAGEGERPAGRRFARYRLGEGPARADARERRIRGPLFGRLEADAEDPRPARPVLPQGRALWRPERLVAWRRQGQVLRGARCLDAGRARRPASSCAR